MITAFTFALFSDAPQLAILTMNVIQLKTIGSFWYIYAPTLTFVHFVYNLTRCVYHLCITMNDKGKASIKRYLMVLLCTLMFIGFIMYVNVMYLFLTLVIS